MHTCIHAYMHTCIHASMHPCNHACMHTYKHTNIQTYTHTHIHTYRHTDIQTYIHTYIYIYYIYIQRERELHVQVDHRKGPHANFIHKMTDDLSSVADDQLRPFGSFRSRLRCWSHWHTGAFCSSRGMVWTACFLPQAKNRCHCNLGMGWLSKVFLFPTKKKLPPSEWTLPWHNMAMLKKVHHALSGATATVPTVTSPERVNRSNYWICVGLGSVPLWPTESHGATLQHTSSYIMELGKPQLPWFGG